MRAAGRSRGDGGLRRCFVFRGAGIEPERGRGLLVRDPWGNLVEIVDYREIQFTKAPEVLAAMGLTGLEKTDAAAAELRAKGVTAPGRS